jgi:formate hydrogenlyase subunit 3/multisubunit Na+/H+ antiporter MnhD subunit
VTWFHIGGLVVALLLSSLPLALLAFTAATLLWGFALPDDARRAAAGPVLRYSALLALAMPLLLGAFRLAEGRLTSEAGTVAVEDIVLALALPGFGLILGLIPLHAWTLTLAAGAPRPMLFGVLGLAQTTAFLMLLRTVALHEWLFRGAYGSFVTFGGATTALLGAWLALSSHPDDPDDWMAYAVVANMGMLVAGVGTGSRAAATGVSIVLLARVLALVLLALRSGAGQRASRLADGAATLTLAGTPPLAAFPGFFLIVTGARAEGTAAAAALVGGSALLMATAVRRWLHAERSGLGEPLALRSGPDRTIVVLACVLVVLGLAPQLVAGALLDPLRDIFFPDMGLPGG